MPLWSLTVCMILDMREFWYVNRLAGERTNRWQVCHCSNCELWVFQIFTTTLLECWEMFQITSLAHHNYIFKKSGKMTWAWGSRQERGERDRWEGGVETARERMKERKKKKEALELFFQFSNVFQKVSRCIEPWGNSLKARLRCTWRKQE